MKQYFLPLISAVILLASCYSEQELIPSEVGRVAGKFEFPQGNTPADAIFERIYQNFGTQVIYREFTEADIMRSWIRPDVTGGQFGEFTWMHMTEQDEIYAAAQMIEERILSLLPAEMTRRALRGSPYIYLTGRISTTTSPHDRLPLFPVRALDGITISLLPSSPSNHFSHQVFFPARIALEFFMDAFSRGDIVLPESWFERGPATDFDLVSWSIANRDPARYDFFWARQGRLPSISMNGLIRMGRNSGFANNSEIAPLGGRYVEVPHFFMYLAMDPNWREHFNPGGIFYDCPRLEYRLNVFFDTMLAHGIDMDAIQETLFSATTIDTSIDRILVRDEASPEVGTYIYWCINNQP